MWVVITRDTVCASLSCMNLGNGICAVRVVCGSAVEFAMCAVETYCDAMLHVPSVRGGGLIPQGNKDVRWATRVGASSNI